jgi:hypothetical protein
LETQTGKKVVTSVNAKTALKENKNSKVIKPKNSKTE